MALALDFEQAVFYVHACSGVELARQLSLAVAHRAKRALKEQKQVETLLYFRPPPLLLRAQFHQTQLITRAHTLLRQMKKSNGLLSDDKTSFSLSNSVRWSRERRQGATFSVRTQYERTFMRSVGEMFRSGNEGGCYGRDRYAS